MNCPRCNSNNPHTAAFCLNCGHRFETPQPAFSAGYAPPPPVLKTGLATASLVVGIISIITFGFGGIGAITGLILGIVAVSNARNYPTTYGGKGAAIAGIVTSGISLFLAIGMVVGGVMFFRTVSQEIARTQEAVTITNIRTLEQAEYSYLLTNNRYGTLNELIEASEINSSWSAPSKNGYKIRIVVSRTYYEIFANPEFYGSTGKRSFYAKSASGTDPIKIHEADRSGHDANDQDPVLTGVGTEGIPGGHPTFSKSPLHSPPPPPPAVKN